jgi:hypothetical protein
MNLLTSKKAKTGQRRQTKYNAKVCNSRLSFVWTFQSCLRQIWIGEFEGASTRRRLTRHWVCSRRVELDGGFQLRRLELQRWRSLGSFPRCNPRQNGTEVATQNDQSQPPAVEWHCHQYVCLSEKQSESDPSPHRLPRFGVIAWRAYLDRRTIGDRRLFDRIQRSRDGRGVRVFVQDAVCRSVRSL